MGYKTNGIIAIFIIYVNMLELLMSLKITKTARGHPGPFGPRLAATERLGVSLVLPWERSGGSRASAAPRSHSGGRALSFLAIKVGSPKPGSG